MGVTYAIVHVEKLKTFGGLNSRCNHNLRKVSVDNANPELAYLNCALVETPMNTDGTRMDYVQAFKERIKSLPYYQDHKIRSNAVLALDVLLTFTRDESVDIDEWKKQSLRWLHKHFDVAPDGKTNLLDVEFHGDETGNAHIHACVCPIDERGRLNAQRFTGGYRVMSELQTSYAKYMKPFGMEAGVHRSSASHKDIGKMYADLNRAIEVPEVLDGESAEEYRARVSEELSTRFASTYRQAEDFAVKARRSSDRYANSVREDLHEEIDRERDALLGLKIDEEDEKEKIESLKDEIKALEDQMFLMRSMTIEAEKMRYQADRYKRLKEGLEAIRAEDAARAEWIEGVFSELESRAGDREIEIDEDEYEER